MEGRREGDRVLLVVFIKSILWWFLRGVPVSIRPDGNKGFTGCIMDVE